MIRKQKTIFQLGLILFLTFSLSSISVAETVKRVADGDTIILRDGRHVRYIGIDAPEIDYKRPRSTPMGSAAKAVNQRLTQAYQLTVIHDAESKDHYGRTLAYVYRNDGLFVNLEMVRRGYAWCLYVPPNVAHTQGLLDAQRQAMAAGTGIWQSVRRSEKFSLSYTGNRRSKRFHHPGCPEGKKISKKHRIIFKRPWDAFWEGFAPHSGCVRLKFEM